MTLFMRDMEKKEEGILEGKLMYYLNMIGEGLSKESAMRMADITEEDAIYAEQLREAGEI